MKGSCVPELICSCMGKAPWNSLSCLANWPSSYSSFVARQSRQTLQRLIHLQIQGVIYLYYCYCVFLLMSDATLHTESVPFQARCSGGVPSPYMSIATAKRAFNVVCIGVTRCSLISLRTPFTIRVRETLCDVYTT